MNQTFIRSCSRIYWSGGSCTYRCKGWKGPRTGRRPTQSQVASASEYQHPYSTDGDSYFSSLRGRRVTEWKLPVFGITVQRFWAFNIFIFQHPQIPKARPKAEAASKVSTFSKALEMSRFTLVGFRLIYRSRWFCGTVAWACNLLRPLTAETDLSYLPVFREHLIAEAHRLDTNVQKEPIMV